MSDDPKEELPSNVVQLTTSHLDTENFLAHIAKAIQSCELESLAVVGIGRRQGLYVSFVNVPYDPVRLLGAVDLGKKELQDFVTDLIGMGDPDASN